MDVFGQLLVEQLDVEPELLGVRAEILVAQALLLLVEKVVRPHKRRDRRMRGMRADAQTSRTRVIATDGIFGFLVSSPLRRVTRKDPSFRIH